MIGSLFEIKYLDAEDLSKGLQHPYYYILSVAGKATFSVEFTEYQCSGYSFIFLSPYQLFKLASAEEEQIETLIFHGDFYCIEYHKKEVACNGVLFNNIYHQPFVSVDEHTYQEIGELIQRMKSFRGADNAYDTSILKSYLQLILALSSKEKQLQIDLSTTEATPFANLTDFQNLLERHYLETKEVAFYADKLGLAVNSFSKKIKKHFGKSPSKLIQERVVLEAKKLLHLTHKPVKEIAADLRFEDEFYFSRYFKKEVGISPKQFRERVGISIVADLSM